MSDTEAQWVGEDVYVTYASERDKRRSLIFLKHKLIHVISQPTASGVTSTLKHSAERLILCFNVDRPSGISEYFVK